MNYKVGIGTAIAICLSSILGDTLFAVTSVPLSLAGSYSLIAYALVAIVTIFIAAQLGELGSLMPKEKGLAYSYVNKSFGTELGFISGVLLFIGFCATIAAVSFSFGGYLTTLLGINSTALQILFAAILIVALSFLNTMGVKETVKLSKALVVVVFLTAAAFVIFAFLHIGSSHGFLLTNKGMTSDKGYINFIDASAAIVFAYAGFQTISSITGHVDGKGRGVAKAMAYAIVISMIVYMLVTLGVMILAPISSVSISSEPLLYAINYAHAPSLFSAMITIGILFSIAAATLTLIFTASRLLYQLGKDGMLPRITKVYDKSRDVAINGIWISALVEILILFSGDLYGIVSISNFGFIFAWIITSFAIINVRRRKRFGDFKSPYFPLVPLASIILCMLFLFGLPRTSLALGVMMILVLLVIYYSLVEIRYKKVQRIRLFD